MEFSKFILQISQHQISVSQNLARLMGFNILSTSTAVGVGELESSGTASSIVLASPNHDRYAYQYMIILGILLMYVACQEKPLKGGFIFGILTL